jgi:hypothetical protein
MLRMVLLSLLIPLGVGVLSAMELRTAQFSAVAIVQPPAGTTTGVSNSQGVLAKADRLEVAAASGEPPVQPASVDERIAPSEGVSIGSSKPPRPINRHRHDAKPKKVAVAAIPKSRPKAAPIKPKAAPVKQTTISQRSRATSDTGLCRLKAFGGLLKALNSAECEI